MKYLGTYYKVTDEKITPTGETELYIQPTLDVAILSALYTHKLHNGRGWVNINVVITCPSCGQIAITKMGDENG